MQYNVKIGLPGFLKHSEFLRSFIIVQFCLACIYLDWGGEIHENCIKLEVYYSKYRLAKSSQLIPSAFRVTRSL